MSTGHDKRGACGTRRRANAVRARGDAVRLFKERVILVTCCGIRAFILKPAAMQQRKKEEELRTVCSFELN
jgi:hypothetical protein